MAVILVCDKMVPLVLCISRFYGAQFAMGIFMDIKPADVVYVAMPLYHMTGGVLGVGQMLCYGATIVIRRKFSVSRFWDDCINYKCTVSVLKYVAMRTTLFPFTFHTLNAFFFAFAFLLFLTSKFLPHSHTQTVALPCLVSTWLPCYFKEQ